MLTRLKLTRGEGQLVEPSSHPSRRKHIPSPQVSRRHSPSMAHEGSHEHVPAEDEDLRKACHGNERDDEDIDRKEYKVAR
jgi:hypothetical protein